MITDLSDKEIKQHNKALVTWLEKALKGERRNDIYNVVLMLKRLVDEN